jgi:pyruvate,water dikinase
MLEPPRHARNDPPPGLWRRDIHRPFPVTPLFADYQLGEHLGEGFRIAEDEFSLPVPRHPVVLIDGYAYDGLRFEPGWPPAERVAAFEEKVRERHEATVLRRWREQVQPANEGELARLGEVNPAALDDRALLRHITAISARLATWYGVHFTNARAGGVVIERCREFCRDLFGIADDEFAALLSGHSAASSVAAVMVAELSETIAGDLQLRATLECDAPLSNRKLAAALQPFLATHARRGSDFDFDVPTLAEEPERLISLLRNWVAEPHHTAAFRAAVTAEREALVASFMDRAGDERDEFARLLSAAQSAHGVRDADLSICLGGNALLRYAFLEAGRRFVERGWIAVRDDVLYLRRAELEAALSGPPETDLAGRAAERRAERDKRRSDGPPPDTIGTPIPWTLPQLSDEGYRWLRWLEPHLLRRRACRSRAG